VSLVGLCEGLRLTAYPDVGDVPTICYGETLNVHMTDTATKAECDQMLAVRLKQFNDAVNSCVQVSLPDTRRASLVSFFYNVGESQACKSTVVRRLNAGDVQGGCDALLMWNKVNGKVVQGLTNRRIKERALCLM
jgi:lysozyme